MRGVFGLTPRPLVGAGCAVLAALAAAGTLHGDFVPLAVGSVAAVAAWALVAARPIYQLARADHFAVEDEEDEPDAHAPLAAEQAPL